MSAEDNSWRTAGFRQSVVQKIEEAVRQSGMNTSKNSLEMENHVFQKAKSKEDYLSYIARLILHVREMNGPSLQSNLETHVFKRSTETAEEIKEKGNLFFTRKMYNEALIFYDQALKLNPSSPLYYGNRTACFLMMGDYRKALDDAIASVKLDPTFLKGQLRLLKCHMALGDTEAASQALSVIKTLDASTEAFERKNFEKLEDNIKRAKSAMGKSNYSVAMSCIDNALEIAVASTQLQLLKAESLIHLGRFDDAKKIANDLNESNQNFSPFYIFGLCFYFQGNLDLAISYAQKILQSSPSHAEAKDLFDKATAFQKLKAQGNILFNKNKYSDAYQVYCHALSVDPKNGALNSKLYFNRGTVHFKLGRISEAVTDYTEAIKLDSNYTKALSRRGQCYIKLNDYEKAIFDLEKVFRAEPLAENKRFLDEAKSALSKSKRKDYYKILDVGGAATLDEIKKAYRKRALIHHPDRHVNSTDSEKVEEERKFKEVGEAYAVLSDPIKRAEYDRSRQQELTAPDINVNFLVNLATSFICKGLFKSALNEAQKAVQLDPSCLRAYLCIIKCHVATGDVMSADTVFNQVQRVHKFTENVTYFNQDFRNLEALKNGMREIDKCMSRHAYVLSLRVVEDTMKIAIASDCLKLLKVECLVYLNRITEAMKFLTLVTAFDGRCNQHNYVKGLCAYYKNNLEQAVQCFSSFFTNKKVGYPRNYLRLCEEMYHKTNRLIESKRIANTAYSKSQFAEALTFYTNALQLDRSASLFNSIIFANRAAVHFQLGHLDECIADCTEALRLDSTYQKALLRRAQCFYNLKQYNRAVSDYEVLFKLSRSPEHKKFLDETRAMLKDDDSVVIIEPEAGTSKSIPKGPRQAKMNEFYSKAKPNLRTRTKKNYKIDSGSGSDSSSDHFVPTKRRRVLNHDSSGESEDEEPRVNTRSSRAKPAAPKPSTESKPKEEPVTRSKTKEETNATTSRTRQARRLKPCDTTTESEESNDENSNFTSSKTSDSSDSEEVFVRKKPNKRTRVESSGDDLEDIKNTYKKKVVSRSTKSEVRVQEQKYKKVVGGKKK